MKQRTLKSSSKQYALFGSATEDEFVVSGILIDLGNITSISESQLSNFTWGVKRMRSSLDEGASYSRALSSSAQVREDKIEERQPHVKAEKNVRAAAAGGGTASPDTPLSFSPSESDDENNHSINKNSMKRSRKQCIDMVEQLIQRGDCLRGEILQNVRKFFIKLKAQNLQQKAMKQTVAKTYYSEEDPRMEINRQTNHRKELAQDYGIAVMPYHHQPLVADQTSQKFQPLFSPITTQLDGLGSINHMGPLGIPDLNISAEEAFGVDLSQPFDMNTAVADRRARFAEARRLRRGIIKIKSMRSACGVTLPRTS